MEAAQWPLWSMFSYWCHGFHLLNLSQMSLVCVCVCLFIRICESENRVKEGGGNRYDAGIKVVLCHYQTISLLRMYWTIFAVVLYSRKQVVVGQMI